MRIYLVRHGETEWNKEERLQGWKDSPLTAKGRRKAEELREELKDISFDRVYSSDQGRAVETAKIIAGRAPKEFPELRELGLGPWEGRIFDEVEKNDGERLRIYFDDPAAHSLPDTEDFHDMVRRIRDFYRILEEGGGDEVLVVSHGVTIQGMLNMIEGKKLDEFWDLPMVDGASLTIIEKDVETYHIVRKGKPVEGKSY